MKTLIQVWTQKIKNVNKNEDCSTSYWGFGDMLRGSIRMYQIAKELNINYIVDIQLHPISKFLKYEKHEYTDFILQNKDNIPFVRGECTIDFIKEIPEKGVGFFMTNNCIDIKPFNEDCKNFFKKFLTPTEEFQEFLNENFKKIPISNYNILHYRVGDNTGIVSTTYKKGFHHLMRSVKLNMENNDILLSDSSKFKNYVYIYFKIFFFKLKIGHIGFENDEEKLKNTMFEFFVLTKAQKIKTYNVYGWVSGFVDWISKLYDIPLDIINV